MASIECLALGVVDLSTIGLTNYIQGAKEIKINLILVPRIIHQLNPE